MLISLLTHKSQPTLSSVVLFIASWGFLESITNPSSKIHFKLHTTATTIVWIKLKDDHNFWDNNAFAIYGLHTNTTARSQRLLQDLTHTHTTMINQISQSATSSSFKTLVETWY